MTKYTSRVLAITATAAFTAAAFLLPSARAQVQVTQSYVPIGVASTDGTSVAWFHQPSSGTVVACRSASVVAASVAGIQCVSAKLP